MNQNPKNTKLEEQVQQILIDLVSDYGAKVTLNVPWSAIEIRSKEIANLIQDRERKLLEKLLANGSGGGNWRRIINQELNKGEK